MTRPARPGEVGIIIHDELGEGKNIGKRLFCKEQCACLSSCNKFTAMEPIADSYGFYCTPGTALCLFKKDVIVLEDPDKGESQVVVIITSTPTETL